MFSEVVHYQELRKVAWTLPEVPLFTKLGEYIGSVGVDGGQGNSDCIFGDCDDHDTYGILGNGDYGPGNGDPMGEYWNP
eukprot:CAMPEP_0181298644 /NCGR_PEP_ID=MMETSP1101-20121128/5896_1 /TAXON_ID=46948 /ORGANISM="Rhodomonas abbreviata, Strain Caron Lab Isolate" /LENGTH=78 /DNA_ID=CAMNT_0023403687 /DNA_START=12 /DNA_END=248 /DNA_ORIENTATION=+